MSENTPVVYIYQHPRTLETYVGSTGSEKIRQAHHLGALRKGNHPNRRLQSAVERNPDFSYVAVPVEDRETAFDLEQSILDEFRGNPLLLNISRDARYGAIEGYRHTEEAKRKIADAARGNKNCVGKKLSEERKQKLIAVNTGRCVSEETREKLRQANTGFTHAPETREKLRLAHLGKTPTEEHRQKIAAAHQGKKKTDDHAARIRAAKEEVARSICAEGVIYKSINEAARQLGLNPGTVYYRVNSPHHSKWLYL